MKITDYLRLLADLHATELTRERLAELQAINFPTTEGFSQPITESDLDELATDFADIYLNGSFHTSPNESVWLDDEELVCQQPMFDVREWYARHDLEAPIWRKMADDHLVNQLLFIAFLLDKAATDNNILLLEETATFMDEHLLRWLLPFSKRVTDHCETAFYAYLGLLTSTYVDKLRDILADVLDAPRPSHEEIENRMKARRRAAIQPQPMQYYPGSAPSW